MELQATPLDQLGASAHGHYKVAEKHTDKASQQYLSAGLYLAEAKQRLDLRKNPDAPMNFAEFLLKYCPIGKSRAYEVIAIADGRKTVEEVRDDMDLSRFDAAPLIAFIATKETDYGTETDG